MLSRVVGTLFGLLKDSTGKPSWTYTLGVPAFTLVTAKYAVAGIHIVTTVAGRSVDIQVGEMSGLDYATAAGCVLTFLTARAFTPEQKAKTQSPEPK